jgi:hypothetical protein
MCSTEESFLFIIIFEAIDAFVPTWREFKNTITV